MEKNSTQKQFFNKYITLLEEQNDLRKTAYSAILLMQRLEKKQLSLDQVAIELRVNKKTKIELKRLESQVTNQRYYASHMHLYIIIFTLLGVSQQLIADYFNIKSHYVRRIKMRYNRGWEERIFHTLRHLKKYKYQDEKNCDRISNLLHHPPSVYGINRTTWTIDLLASVLNQGIETRQKKIGKNTISASIRFMGYNFRKTREVLTSNDPDYKIKLKKITNTLKRLGPADRFFSIDEYGPVSVRKRGGRLRVLRGLKPTIPQYQDSKGKITLTAALELYNNQITYFYSDKKDTEEMIKLVHVLMARYHYCRRLYFSWDAASWHSSRKFLQEIQRVNSKVYQNTYQTPKIILRPLPARAQFLNVIESVFSGMSASVIKNSDYQSVDELKNAIDIYIAERNQFFRKNPHSAGNKIWGKERTKPVFSVSHNCKNPSFQSIAAYK